MATLLFRSTNANAIAPGSLEDPHFDEASLKNAFPVFVHLIGDQQLCFLPVWDEERGFIAHEMERDPGVSKCKARWRDPFLEVPIEGIPAAGDEIPLDDLKGKDAARLGRHLSYLLNSPCANAQRRNGCRYCIGGWKRESFPAFSRR